MSGDTGARGSMVNMCFTCISQRYFWDGWGFMGGGAGADTMISEMEREGKEGISVRGRRCFDLRGSALFGISEEGDVGQGKEWAATPWVRTEWS